MVAKMKSIVLNLPGFIGRHWLRVVIIGVALIVVNRKQVNFNVRLGAPAPTYQTPGEVLPEPGPPPAGVTQPVEATTPPSLMSRLFGEGETATEGVQEVPAAKQLTQAATQQPGLLERFSLFNSSKQPTLYDHFARTDAATVTAYIRRFSNVAQAEQDKFGIPASIILANGLLHTNSGTSGLAQYLNNYFALPCGPGYAGEYRTESGACNRRYETAWLSFRDHSKYITSGRYQPMRQFSKTDYRRWAAGLEELGFNGTPDLARQLIAVIEQHQLFRFD